jgi:opacity protein-like surface antigen
MKRGLILIVTAAICLAAASPTQGGVGIGGRYSYVRNNGIEDNSDMLGVIVRLRQAMILGIEGAIDFREEELNDGSRLRATPITASLMLYPIPVAYGLAGIGLYRTKLELDSDESTDTQLGYHFGGGIEAPIVPLLKFTADIRYQFIDYDFDDLPEAVGKFDADGYAISAGLIVYLK